jgi:hypothetical protein
MREVKNKGRNERNETFIPHEQNCTLLNLSYQQVLEGVSDSNVCLESSLKCGTEVNYTASQKYVNIDHICT